MRVALVFNVKPEGISEEVDEETTDSQGFAELSREDDYYAEWDTPETINAVKNALEEYHTVTLIEADQNVFEKLKENKPEIVFNVAEGMFGISREAQVPAMCDFLRIPYSGSSPLTLATCLDKGRTKEILSYHKIPVSHFKVVNTFEELDDAGLIYPLMVKPNGEGSSKGIFHSSFVNNRKQLEAEVERVLNGYDGSCLIEEYLPGREFTVALLGNTPDVEVLPIVEILFDDFPKDMLPLYSYEAKWLIDTRDTPLKAFNTPADVSEELKNAITKTALDTYRVLDCKDWSRIDLRCDAQGIPHVIEINPLPGILPDPRDNSSFPKAAYAAGYTYTEMINKVLFTAAKRYGLL